MWSMTKGQATFLYVCLVTGLITIAAGAISLFGAGAYVFYLGLKAAFL